MVALLTITLESTLGRKPSRYDRTPRFLSTSLHQIRLPRVSDQTVTLTYTSENLPFTFSVKGGYVVSIDRTESLSKIFSVTVRSKHRQIVSYSWPFTPYVQTLRVSII
jgi:hypothetical protein